MEQYRRRNPLLFLERPEDEYWGCAHSLLDEGGRDACPSKKYGR